MNNLFFLILLILPIILIVFIIIKKKNGDNYQKKQRKEERDEVWATVKKFLKQNDEIGKEVIDTFTVKRPNPYDVSSMTKEQKIEFKAKEKRIKELKHSNPEEYKKVVAEEKMARRKKQRDLYIVIFVSRDTKTGVQDEPRALECEVVMKRIDKKRTQRIIEIVGLADYEKEMQWIKPIKDKHDKVYLDRIKRAQERKLKQEQKQAKLAAKQEAKNNKHNSSTPDVLLIDSKENQQTIE